MFNKICVKDEYLIKVSFLKYSGLLDYLVYLFSSGVCRLEVCCVIKKTHNLAHRTTLFGFCNCNIRVIIIGGY
jgi:hypothetical protein